MKNNEKEYKGYIIDPQPYWLPESKRWRPKMFIFRRPSPGINIEQRPFTDRKNTFESKDEAIEHCFIYGAEIIDGNIPECSISDL